MSKISRSGYVITLCKHTSGDPTGGHSTGCCGHTAIDCTTIELDYILLLINKRVPISSQFYTILEISLQLQSLKLSFHDHEIRNQRQVPGGLSKYYA